MTATVKDSFGNTVSVGDTVQVTARRGGLGRYRDRRITREVLDITPQGMLLLFDADWNQREIHPNDTTRLDDKGEPMIRWNA